MKSTITYEHIYGCLMGTALGDSMGLPFEGLSRKKIAKKKFDFKRQHLFLKRGFFSDDTEQTILVAQTLIESYDDEVSFQKKMRKKLQYWLSALPAGVGMATLRSIGRSFFLKNPAVFSAGNAPAMRCAILGVLFGDDNKKLQKMIHINTKLTHDDPKAYFGALSVGVASYLSMIGEEETFFDKMKALVEDEEFRELLDNVQNHLTLSSVEFAKKLGLEKEVGGYIYHTLPMVLHVWLKDIVQNVSESEASAPNKARLKPSIPNTEHFEQAIIEMIQCGGDTDTTSAILGAIIGAKGDPLPQRWIEGIVDYPLSVKLIDEVSLRLTKCVIQKTPQKPLWIPYPFVLLRNMVFLLIVLIVFIVREVV